MNSQRGQFVDSQQLGRGNSAAGSQLSSNGSSSYEANDQPFFRLDLVRSFQLHKRMVLAFALAGLVLAAGYVARKWPVYTAESRVYIQPLSGKVMESGYTAHWPDDANTYDSFIGQQVQSAFHPDVLLNAVHKLPPGIWQHGGESDDAAAQRLGRAVDVARVGVSYEIAITAHARDPEAAAGIANAMAASLVEQTSREEKAGNAERLVVLREEQGRVQKALDDDRAEQASLNAVLGVAAVGLAIPDHYDDEIGKVHEELVKARTAHDEADAKLIALDAGGDGSHKALDAEADDVVAADPGLSSMKLSLNQRRALLISQMANLTPSHPQYKQNTAELAQIDSALESMSMELRAKASSRMQQRLRADLDQAAGVESRLNAQLGQLAATAGSATPKLQRASDLATDVLRLQNRRTIVDEQMHNLMLEDSVPGAAHLSAAAVAPLSPNMSGIARKALPVALGGLLLGLLAALIANNLDQKIYIAADMQRILGFGPMAQIPNFDQVSARVAEEHLLRLAASIEHAFQCGSLKSCIFTAAGTGAGVTTVVNKVSSMLDSMGRPTLLVDAGWTPPPVSDKGFGGPGSNGNSAEQAAQRGSRSTALLYQLSEENETNDDRLVLTDTAPVGVSVETEYLARFVDAAIVIVESGVTTRAQLHEAASTLQKLDVPTVGFVLNRIDLNKADHSFRNSVRVTEQYHRLQPRSFKQDLEDMQNQRRSRIAADSEAAPRIGNRPRPETHVFYLPEWKATNPTGDAEAARAEAIRLGYEVVER
jgi:uncharacterized protein involved in exopolysaccharide biosynthesis